MRTEKERTDGIIKEMIGNETSYDAIIRTVCLGVKKTVDPKAEYPLYASEHCMFVGCPYLTGGENILPDTVHIQDYRCGLKEQISKTGDKADFRAVHIFPPVPICKERLEFLADSPHLY